MKRQAQHRVFSDEFKQDHIKQTQWMAFLRKHNLQFETTFRTVVNTIEQFLEPLFDGSLRDKNCIWAKKMWTVKNEIK